MKKTILIVTLVLVASALLIAAAPGFDKLAKLTIWNRTGETIYIQLTTPKTDGNLFYYLTVKPGEHTFTLERKVYDVKYWSCGTSTSAFLDLYTSVHLTFTNCNYLHRWTYTLKLPYPFVGPFNTPNVMNPGEPGMEKVHNRVSRWEWRNYVVEIYDAEGNLIEEIVEWYWGSRTYRSPWFLDSFFSPWRFSYDAPSARQVHYLERVDKRISDYTFIY